MKTMFYAMTTLFVTWTNFGKKKLISVSVAFRIQTISAFSRNQSIKFHIKCDYF
jgi:hypothetical protein